MCGGTPAALHPVADVAGLSPRVRGNPRPTNRPTNWRRSIPACAGEPVQGNRRGVESGVYPRVCGGTRSAAAHSGVDSGGKGGSIPACAGEPPWASATGASRAVFPRVCGGTAAGKPAARTLSGLSPRVRGNPARATGWWRRSRSIPACAGEPRPRHGAAHSAGVYPRVCGGTGVRRGRPGRGYGLSPRVRGNPLHNYAQVALTGSIPACAGEPLQPVRPGCMEQVYPRVCGGTECGIQTLARVNGLSPRVRGNRSG